MAAGDANTTDLTAKTLNGTITDGAGNALTNAGFTTIDTQDIVDTTAPTVTSLTDATSNGADLNAGQSGTFTLNASETLVATGASLTLNNGATALYASGSGSSGIVIQDGGVNVASAMDLFSADLHINAITLTDSGTPILTLTAIEALDDTTALQKITNPPFKVDIADSAANLESLTPALINSLAGLGVTSVVSTDGSLSFHWTQSAALQAAGILPIAPAGDIAHEGFANNTALSWLFGQNGTVDSLLTRTSDGAFDVHHYVAAGVFHGVTYARTDIDFSATGVRDGATYYAANGDIAASATFSANGGFTLTVSGQPTQSKIIDADGSLEVGFTGVTGQSFRSFQNDFTSANTFVAHSQDNVGGGSGRVNILVDNLVVAATGGKIGPLTAPNDFTFTPHSNEIFAFQAGATDDVLDLGSTGFGADVINNFGHPSAATDSLNRSALFTDYNDLVSHATAMGSNLVIADHIGDTITVGACSNLR